MRIPREVWSKQPEHSNCLGLTLSIRLNRPVARLAVRSKNKRLKEYINNEVRVR
ncbi:hypothetical protein M404DRAFT_1000314 [Pisolithus tinctorius Marx 270]|uniref:Uncharacterized protein n=1 Tax=Pisolithus tinctorius Marx 270 TaxID=870435 RepID=A0A0C3J6W8_PISTI|nr:hypothetical protein M404DRAFT_1000314 [Pisolithus tinctorius Marx 270]